MKTIKATRFKKAQKELAALDNDLAKKLSADIKHPDRKHYHAILVRVEDRPGQVKNKVSNIISQYSKEGFKKISDNYKFHGFNQIILLHDPTLMDEEDDIQVPQHVVTAAKAKATRETQKSRQQEIDEAVAEAKKQWIEDQKAEKEKADKEAKENEVKKNEEVKELSPEDERAKIESDYAVAMAGNKADLVVFMETNKIPHADLSNNEGRKKRITKWFEEYMAKTEKDGSEGGGTNDGDGGSTDGDDGNDGDDNGTNVDNGGVDTATT